MTSLYNVFNVNVAPPTPTPIHEDSDGSTTVELKVKTGGKKSSK